MIWVSFQELYLCILYRCKVEQHDALLLNGMTILEIAYLDNEKRITLRVWSSGSAFCRERESMQKLKELVELLTLNFSSVLS